MSLISELEDLGELMANNLVTMGVTDAQASDGLTTLANKILDISPTPVTQTLTLTSDKSILSYLDSETATLTATLTGGTVSGQTIEFFKGSTSLGTATTDNNGLATLTDGYTSTGAGDVTITAECGALSDTYTLSDIYLARLNEVTVTRSSSSYMDYDSDLTMSSFPSSYELTVDLKTTGATTGNEHRVYLAPKSAYDYSMTNPSQPNPSIYIGFDVSNAQCGTRTTSSSNANKSVSNLNNTYHSFKVVKSGNSYQFYVDNMSITGKTFSNMNSYSEFKFLVVMWSNGTLNIKNLKIKAL